MKNKSLKLLVVIGISMSFINFSPKAYAGALMEVSDHHYFEKVKELIAEAKKSIDISMETFSLSQDPDDPVFQLVRHLMAAQKKGVRVRLFLNTFSAGKSSEPGLFLRDDVLYQMRRLGAEIHFVSPQYHLRDRLMMIDGKLILEGGIPWAQKDLENPKGSAILIESAPVADQKRIRLEFLPLWDIEQKKMQRTDGEVGVPFHVLQELRIFPSMVIHEDGDAMKIYFKLLRIFYETQETNLTVILEDLGQEIPAADNYEREILLFHSAKALERLAAEYQLIKIQEKQADRFKIEIVIPRSEPLIEVPIDFFRENYAKDLSPGAIFAYLVILYRTQISGQAPVWLGSEHNVEQDFPLTKEKFRIGIAELRAKNIIEVFPFKLKDGYRELESLEYRYLLNPLKTLSERLETWDRLRQEFGEDHLKEAQELAGLFGEPEDPKVVSVYLKLLTDFNKHDVWALTERLAMLPPQSTPDLLNYLQTILEHETKKTQLATF